MVGGKTQESNAGFLFSRNGVQNGLYCVVVFGWWEGKLTEVVLVSAGSDLPICRHYGVKKKERGFEEEEDERERLGLEELEQEKR